MTIEITNLEKEILAAIEEDPSSYLSRFNSVKEEATRALKKRKMLIWVEGPLGCGKSTLSQVLAKLLEIECFLEDPDHKVISRYLKMLYSDDFNIRKLGAFGINNAYLPFRMQQYHEALQNATSCILDRISYADDIYMKGFIEDKLMTEEQVEDIRKRREIEIKMLKPDNYITGPREIMIQITGEPETFYRRKNKRGRNAEIENGGSGVPLEYLNRLTKLYNNMPNILEGAGFKGPVIQVKQELGKYGEFEPANQRHITPILEKIRDHAS